MTSEVVDKEEQDATKETEKSLFEKEINTFISHIDSLNTSSNIIMFFISAFGNSAIKDFDDFCTRNGIMSEDKKIIDNIQLDRNTYKIFKKMFRDRNDYSIALKILPQSFVVSLVSQYDAFLGRLIRTMFYMKPEILNSSEKEIKLAELLTYSSIEDAKEAIIEKEVEGVLRDSHKEQFDWLKSKLSINFKTDLTIWPEFIEITERRNLFVHCNGIISSQYLKQCRKDGYEIKSHQKVGDRLTVNSAYWDNAFKCIYEIGVKLGHVIWRKICPDEHEEADRHINNLSVDLIDNDRLSLANTLLDFILETEPIFKKVKEEYKLMLLVNKAQTEKWLGNDEKTREIIALKDWSAYGNRFILAKEVLLDNFDEAARIMSLIGSSGEIEKEHYRDWPLFRQFRKSDMFLNTYKEVFGESFEIIKIPLSPFESVLKLLKEIKKTDNN
jgi:hypothetical protein